MHQFPSDILVGYPDTGPHFRRHRTEGARFSMSSLPKPCLQPGCAQLVRSGSRCETHRVEAERRHDQRRPGANRRGYGARHREWRKQVLERDPVCVICRGAPSTVADHIVPIREGGARFDLANGQGLCTTCHSSVKQSREKRGRKR